MGRQSFSLLSIAALLLASVFIHQPNGFSMCQAAPVGDDSSDTNSIFRQHLKTTGNIINFTDKEHGHNFKTDRKDQFLQNLILSHFGNNNMDEIVDTDMIHKVYYILSITFKYLYYIFNIKIFISLQNFTQDVLQKLTEKRSVLEERVEEIAQNPALLKKMFLQILPQIFDYLIPDNEIKEESSREKRSLNQGKNVY